MADFYTSYFGNNYSPRVRLSIGVANVTGNVARVTWILDYVPTSGYAASTNGVARSWTVSIDGQVRSGSFNINGISGATRISSGTIDVSRTNTTRNISCTGSFNFDITWSGVYSGSRTASGSASIQARVSNTVSYNANGGTGAPGSQTKWYGEVLTLSTTKPTRTGYTFKGWSTSATGSVNYQPGGQYGEDATRTLYAVWQADTYTVSYDANGGSGAPSSQTKTHDVNLTLSSTKPTRTNYNFLGWGTSSGSSTVSYAAGATYTSNSSVTLYAIWELAYTAPRITSVKMDRCNSAGTLSESGTYVKVAFSWATDYNVSAIYIRHKVSTTTSWTTTTVSATGRTGSVSQVIGSNGISTEYVYNIQIEVRDSNGSSIIGQDVPAMSYVIDFKAGGKGIAIGKPATEDNLFEINFPTRFTGGISPIAIPNNSDLNDYKTPGYFYHPVNSGAATINNCPEPYAFALEVLRHATAGGVDSGRTQRLTIYTIVKPRTWMRNYYNGTWGSWFEVFFANDFNSSFDSRLANTAATFKGEIGLPYGLKCRAYKIGRMITLNMSRQIVEWTGVKENGVASESLPAWAKPMSETTYVLTRNSGTTIYNPTILHLRSDGSIAYTCSNGGSFVHTGTVTYMCSNAD